MLVVVVHDEAADDGLDLDGAEGRVAPLESRFVVVAPVAEEDGADEARRVGLSTGAALVVRTPDVGEAVASPADTAAFAAVGGLEDVDFHVGPHLDEAVELGVVVGRDVGADEVGGRDPGTDQVGVRDPGTDQVGGRDPGTDQVGAGTDQVGGRDLGQIRWEQGA